MRLKLRAAHVSSLGVFRAAAVAHAQHALLRNHKHAALAVADHLCGVVASIHTGTHRRVCTGVCVLGCTMVVID